jgi:hypothetical protein
MSNEDAEVVLNERLGLFGVGSPFEGNFK